MVVNLAMIYAWTGDKDLALQTLTGFLAGPHHHILVYGQLKCDPAWDTLRGDPRFEAIVASLAPK